MSKSIWFWLIMALWLLSLIYGNWLLIEASSYRWIPGSVILFVLLGLLGWRVFGSPVKD